MFGRWWLLLGLLLWPVGAHGEPLMVGGDVSMLPELEKAGARYSDEGRAGDAIEILRGRGANLFRLRVFVNPSRDFNRSWGAVQDLESMVALGARIRKAGGKLLLTIHYSDTWADPQHQQKPAAWKDLHGVVLEEKVEEYTREVVRRFAEGGARLEMVQTGNEITPGMLWPDGRIVGKGSEEEKRASWKGLARLLAAGIRGARAGDREVKTLLHTHGGGEKDVPTWFFSQLAEQKVDYDLIGLSFYPAFSGRLETLTENVTKLAERYGKDILIVETSYPWRPLGDLKDRSGMKWEESKSGQARFWQDTLQALRENPRVIGLLWWYPEAIPTKGLDIWRNGAEALFDEQGNLLPAGQRFSVPNGPQTQP